MHHRADKRGYVFEHIVVAEKVIGRRMEPDEVAHHLNGDRTDNRPENLAVMLKKEHDRLSSLRRKRDSKGRWR